MLLAEHFSLEKEDVPHPVYFKIIIQYQQKDKSLIETAESNKDYSTTHFHVANKNVVLICTKHKMWFPT